MDKLTYIFLGATNYSKSLLIHLIENGYIPQAIFAIPQEFSISYSKDKIRNSNYADLKAIAIKHNIDYFEVDSVEDKKLQDYKNIIKYMNLDLILVLGWYYMVPQSIRKLSRLGAWGIHASMLPNYAGGAPLNWAIINGESKTGVTLFKLGKGIDDGDIIYQQKFDINFEDTIKEVYEKATQTSKEVLINILKDVDNITLTKQDTSNRKIYSQRKPEDGEIDLNMSSYKLYNFIRAQSSPYPGAYIKTVDGKKLIIEKARIEEL